MKKFISTIAFWVILTSISFGQDNHYSLSGFQYGSLNPSIIGLDQDDGEIRSIYRTQWNNIVPITYMTLECEKQDELWGYGINWNKNGAGVGSIITNQIIAGASRQVDLNSYSFLRLGMQLGYYQQALDWNGATFESQFNSNGTIGTDNGESLGLDKANSIDLNSGLFYRKESKNSILNAGFSLSHLAQNKLSLYIDGNESLPARKTAHVKLNIKRENNWQLSPSILYQSQGTASESTISLIATKTLEEEKSISFGAGLRPKDALFIQAEFQLESISIGMAYDSNISKLSQVTNGFGAFEIGLKFRFNKPVDYDKNVNLRMLDTDGDGIADESDHCPEIRGNSANKGCPGRADSDNDGIVDEVDLCPGLSGNPVHGGCPDSDGDGVADIDDECPTVYGAIHFQGCPDSDQDGISDKYDACPTTFGVLSNKGCPSSKVVQPTTTFGEYIVEEADTSETKTSQVLPIQRPSTNHQHSYNINEYSRERNENYTAPNNQNNTLNNYDNPSPGRKLIETGEVMDNLMIFFDKDDSVLDFQDKKRLRDFVITLGSDPRLKIVLKGHTDEDGGDLYNMELGYRRAESVKRYLSQFGLTQDRIMSLSYGEEMPLSHLQGEVADAKNRRVELILVK